VRGKGRRARRRSGENAFTLARRFTLAPILAGEGSDLAAHLIEPAWDGHRVLATRVGDDVRLASSDFRDWTATFPAAARGLAKLPAQSLALDGVLCVLTDGGAPSFDALRAQVAAGPSTAVLICWDLLSVDGEDLRARPLAERRARLATLLAKAPSSVIASQALDGELERVLSVVRTLGMTGVVARPLGGAYDAPWRAWPRVDELRSLSPPPPLSNADKVLFPRDGITKRELVAYYRDVAPVMVRYLIDRPVVVQRWPDGIDEFDWYQHRVPPRAPDYMRAAWVDGVRRIVLENSDALLWMVNQAGLTYHVFASRLAALAEPDYAMIDLDPGDRDDLIEVALAVRRVLELLDLPSVVKTSGQRGLHVLVPLAPGHSFDAAEQLGRGIAELLVRLMPDKVTIENEKEKRRGRLLVDHKQFLAKTLVAPYSLRAADGAPASTPIAWDEVTPALRPRDWNLRTLRARLDARGDLAAPLLSGTTQLDRALTQLRAQR